MSHIIVGFGEVGRGLREVLPEANVYDIKETFLPNRSAYEFMHIAFPCVDRDEFIKSVFEYFRFFHPRVIVVHSTVPVGTTRDLGPHAVHSPIRGVHPHLGEGIRTFVKYFGGRCAEEAAQVFSSRGIQTRCVTDSRVTEAIKLWDTTQYGWQIVLMKEIHRWCEAHEVDFNLVYSEANKDYNDGYTRLGRPEVVRPHLHHLPGPIGGHCVIPNCSLLESPIAEIIKDLNRRY